VTIAIFRCYHQDGSMSYESVCLGGGVLDRKLETAHEDLEKVYAEVELAELW